LCRRAILRSEVILVEKWEADLRSIQSKLKKQKKKSVTGEQNMKILRKKRRN